MKTEESTFDKMRTRPRFKMYSHLEPEEYSEKIKNYLAEHPEFQGNVNREAATICVKTPEDNYWKPRLTLRAEQEDEKTVIRGIFGPSSAVWTFFMFLYFILGILWMVFFTIFFVERQIKSNDFPWALSASFVVLVLIFLTYFAARFGQRKAKDEMEKLRSFAIESTLQFEKEEL